MARYPERRRDFSGIESGLSCVRHVGHTKITSSRPGLGPHVHPNCYEICYLRSGQMHWWAGDEDNEYVVSPGEMTVTFPDEIHGGVDSIHEACDLYWISIENDPAVFGISPDIMDPVRQGMAQVPRHFSAPKSVPDYFEAILDAIESPGPYVKFRILSAVQQIILQMIDGLRADSKSPDPRMERVLAATAGHIELFKSVDDLAALAGLSPNRFINQFKAYTGYSPMDYLNREKLRRAKVLLSDQQRSITDIAFELDFSTTQYFATMFKKYTGMTPSQFRSEAFL